MINIEIPDLTIANLTDFRITLGKSKPITVNVAELITPFDTNNSKLVTDFGTKFTQLLFVEESLNSNAADAAGQLILAKRKADSITRASWNEAEMGKRTEDAVKAQVEQTKDVAELSELVISLTNARTFVQTIVNLCKVKHAGLFKQ